MAFAKTKAPTCAPGTAVAYARYSSAGQRDVSIEQQLHDIRSFAKREGLTIVHEYSDHARSGFKNVNARTAFQSMMAAADSGSFDTVICWKVDRFGRNREESATYKGRLRRRGVKVLYAMEPIPEGSAGVLLEGMLEATAEWYSMTLSENVSRGMADNAARCLFNGARILGYTRGSDGRYAILPDEAAVVRNIFDLYRSGYSASRVSRILNAQGLRTSRNKPFSPEAVMRIVSNEKYAGVYIWKETRVPGGVPAIIDQSVFEEAQRMKGKTSRHVEQGAVDYLLTGKAFCGECGAAMIGDSGTSKDGTRHPASLLHLPGPQGPEGLHEALPPEGGPGDRRAGFHPRPCPHRAGDQQHRRRRHGAPGGRAEALPSGRDGGRIRGDEAQNRQHQQRHRERHLELLDLRRAEGA